jgi:hypothetical protein
MEDNIVIKHLSSCNGEEERDLLTLEVTRKGEEYIWEVFVPVGRMDWDDFIAEVKPKVFSEIDEKVAIWEALEPKTVVSTGIMGEEIVRQISKHEIVKSENPDYYAKRRAEYPRLAEQLDALWKGTNSTEYIAMEQRILAIKSKYPKL